MTARELRNWLWQVALCSVVPAALLVAGLGAMPGASRAVGRSAGPVGLAGSMAPTGDFANGSVLPNGRLVTPIGQRFTLGDFPLGLAVSPDGSLAVAINSGYGSGLNAGFNSYCTARAQGSAPCPYLHPAQPQLAATAGDPATHAPDESLSVVDLRTGHVATVEAGPTGYNPAQRAFNLFYCGVVFSPDGRHLYAAGGGNDAIYDFPVRNGRIGPRPLRTVTLPSGVPAFIGAGYTKGLAVTPDGRYLLVTHEMNNSLDIVDTVHYSVRQLALGAPVGGGQYPYGVALSPDGRVAYVALQGAGQLAVVDLANGSGRLRRLVHVGDHPTAVAVSPDGSQVYVANADDDTLSVVRTADMQSAATISLHVLSGEAVGATPNAVSVSPDGRRLYVALAGDDAVAVLGARTSAGGGSAGVASAVPAPGDWAVYGFIPAGWYPSAVVATHGAGGTGDMVYIVSAKGLGSRPTAVTSSFTYDGDNMPGLLQAVVPQDGAALQAGAQQAADDIRFATLGAGAPTSHNPIPSRSGGSTPIQHVVLIVRENRTFDQVLGDVGGQVGRDRTQIDGEPAYTIFGRDVTPNAHALVGDPVPGTTDPAYATSDNFYSDGEASIQGHYWTSSAAVNDYIEKSWRQYYSPRHRFQDPISSIGEPHGCSIFQAALWRQNSSGGKFSFRDYGEVIGLANPAAIMAGLFVPGNLSPGVPEHCTPVPVSDITFATGSNFNLDTDNRQTATTFLHDAGLDVSGAPLKGAAPAQRLRSFSYLIMAGDHTGGLAFANTPRSRVAQNDAGLGLIVQALSHSPYWSSTAIFVMEDDSQDGLDHRDGHRNLLYVISPYAKHVGPDGKPGFVGHLHYSRASMLRTIELICGLPVLSTYDENARALYDLFQDKDSVSQLSSDDLRPFTLQPAPPFIDETSAQYRRSNAAGTSMAAAESRQLDLSAPDAAGPLLEIVDWRLAHPEVPPPAALLREESTWRLLTSGGSRRQGK